MTLTALGLMVGSAFAHAGWNYLAKRTEAGPAFLWASTAASLVLYAPVAAVALVLQRSQLGWAGLGFIAGSSVLHLVYFVLLFPVTRGVDRFYRSVAHLGRS